MSSWAVPGYTEGRELGRGASGRVVAATSEATGQRVAIKYLSASMVGDPEYMARFREEARLLTELDVPQVVRLLAYVEEPGAGAAIVMELVDGVSLHELISRQGATGPESALAVLKGSLLGLAAAHSLGIVHRDYKPENVLVDAVGASKLADFGVAVRAGHRVPAAGTPLYMAPEQWAGEPASPATDIYAATAVFYECLTGRTPFSGRLRQLRGQHERAAVPSADVDEPLRPLVERGMAKDPAARPVNAATFVAELDATAAAAYGPDWEQRGRGQLAARAAALLLLLLHGRPVAGSAPATDAVTWFLRRKKAVLGVIAVVVAGAVAIAGAAIASQTPPPHHRVTSTSFTLPRQPVVTASATATPPAAAGSCKKPTAFTYSATLAADQPGTLTYRWVYSSGTKNGRPRMGPLRTVRFAAAGSRLVSGGVTRTRTAGSGWAEIEVTSPVRATSNRAGYLLICTSGRQSGDVAAAAAAAPVASTVTCGTPPPSFTFTGTVTSAKAGQVTYYWALGDGATSAPATLLFKAPGRMNVRQLPFTPPTDSGTGTAVIVVTSPVTLVSNTATFTLSCDAAGHGRGGGTPLSLSASAHVSPAASTVGCAFSPSTFTFTGSITANQATSVTYYWALNSGDGPLQTLTFAGAGTEAVAADTFTPPSDTYTGAGEIVIASPATSPPAKPSNTMTFKQSCTNASLHVITTSLPAALQNEPYSATVNAAGGKTPYSWSATGLPAGLSISSGGVISGTPATAGTFSVTVTVADSESATARTASASTPTAQTGSASLTLVVKPSSFPKLDITAAGLPAATQGAAYSATVNAAGGEPPYSWSATGLPAGLAISSGGVISGAATTAGTYTVTVTVTDGETPTAQTASASLTLTVNPAYPELSINPASLLAATQGAKYSASAGSAAGGDGSYTWSATGLPEGLFISSGGAISGAATTAGTYTVTVTVTDGETPTPQTASASLTLTVNPAYPRLSITAAGLLAATQGAKYSASAGSAAGGDGSYTWSATGLPEGLFISSGGAISGAATTAGTYTVTVTVTDGETPTPQTASASLTLTVNPAYPRLSITAAGLPAATQGAKYSASAGSAAGGDGSYTWSATGLPEGLSISSGGAISGAPATAGTYTVTVTVTDGETPTPQTASASVTLTVNAPSPPPSTPPIQLHR